MIEIGLGKLVLLALVALIVLGPEKLPGAARTAGALLRRVRNGWDGVRAEVERELQIEELKRAAREAAIRAEAVQAEVKSVVDDVRAPLAQAAAEIAPGAIVESIASLRSEEAELTDVSKETLGSEATLDRVELNISEPAHLVSDRVNLNHTVAKEYMHGGV
jgi:sec-independent protein translocase protein TatB